ncbi:hypothetical protein B0J18DRAFT_436613 [Chaetomium sp. MPI-SDFR-AT-0129]|nr:hypothetical protein B0J18DRAFT_436613 [Chaetomium sp. MPI-SDFR-AT-0129]
MAGGSSSSPPCQINTTQDLYGIGIRTGIYCQWAATMAAGIALPEETAAIRTNTICFQCAILGALILMTARGSIAQPEVLIIVPLAFGGFSAAQTFEYGTSLVGTGTATGTGTAKGAGASASASPLRTQIMLQIFGVLVGYSLWFWWEGVETVSPAGCTYYAFVFGKVSIVRLRVFGIVMSIFGGICFVNAEVLVLVVPMLSCIRSGRRVTAQYFITTPGRISSGGKETPRWQIWVRIAINVVSVCYFIVMIELTLAWNPTIKGANTLESVGQLVPLVVGVTGLLRISYLLLRKPLQVGSSRSRRQSLPREIDLGDGTEQHPRRVYTLNSYMQSG